MLCRSGGKRQFAVHLSQQKKIKAFACLSFTELCPFLKNVVCQEHCYTGALENASKTAGLKDTKYKKKRNAKINWSWSSTYEYTEQIN